jgi:DNA-binding CsgD family transcriptional regulator
MKKINGFVKGLSFPACVIDKTGKLALVNPAMKSLYGDGGELSIFGPCDFTPSKESNDCGNCGRYPVTKGKCVIPRVTPLARLVMAAGLEKMGGATVAFYENGSAVNPLDAHAALGEILSLSGAGKTKSRVTTVSAQGKWKASLPLKELVEMALKGLETGGARLEMKVGGVVWMDFASLSAARLVIRRMGVELLGLASEKALQARMYKKSRSGESAHIISIKVNIGRHAPKARSSKISAIELRLSRFCQRLGRMMGLAIPAPVTLSDGEEGEVQLTFELAGGFATVEWDGRSIFSLLSNRERELVELVVEGFNNDEISKKMGITVSTVKQHIKNIYRRTGVKSRSELIFRAGG